MGYAAGKQKIRLNRRTDVNGKKFPPLLLICPSKTISHVLDFWFVHDSGVSQVTLHRRGQWKKFFFSEQFLGKGTGSTQMLSHIISETVFKKKHLPSSIQQL